jgi:hypothetical protein
MAAAIGLLNLRSTVLIDNVPPLNLGRRIASTHLSKTHPTMGFQLWRTRVDEF